MGKKPRLTFRKNYKIKRAIRNKLRRQEDGTEAEEHTEMNEETISRENSTAPTSVISTSSEEDIPTSQPSQTAQKEDTVHSQQVVTCRSIQQTREYHKGDYVLIKIDRRVPLMVFSVQCIVKDGINGKVRGLVYARPDDTPHKRQHYHGEHELLVFYKPVTFTCAQLFKMEQPSSTEWDIGLPLGPPPPPSPPSPTASSGSHSSSTVALYCNENMETEDCSSSHSSGNPSSESDSPRFQLLAVSYSKYCRYRAVLKRLGAAAYRLMDQPLVQAMGGLSGQYYTQLVFTRKTFRDMTLERKLELLDTLSVPAKRTSTKADSSNSQHGSTSDSMRPPPTKRQRGRPRKHRLLSNNSSVPSSSSVTPSKKRLKLMMPSRSYSSSQHEGTPLPHTITKRGDHHLRNRAAIQRPVYFRDSFFALEDAIAYAKMQSKHLERKRKASTTQQPTAKAPSKSAQNQSNSKSPTPSSTPPPVQTSPKKVAPPLSHKSPDTATCKAHPNDTAVHKTFSEDTLSRKIHTNDTSRKTHTDDTSIKKHTNDTASHNDSTTSNVSQSSLPNLEKYLVSEKAFMELLLCFMRMMKTPLKQLPKLGSKEMSLYELYKVTSSLGGYDEVTSRCQWEMVHKILGYGILCSPNTVRERYYEFLVPFEKALKAMQNTK